MSLQKAQSVDLGLIIMSNKHNINKPQSNVEKDIEVSLTLECQAYYVPGETTSYFPLEPPDQPELKDIRVYLAYEDWELGRGKFTNYIDLFDYLPQSIKDQIGHELFELGDEHES